MNTDKCRVPGNFEQKLLENDDLLFELFSALDLEDTLSSFDGNDEGLKRYLSSIVCWLKQCVMHDNSIDFDNCTEVSQDTITNIISAIENYTRKKIDNYKGDFNLSHAILSLSPFLSVNDIFDITQYIAVQASDYLHIKLDAIKTQKPYDFNTLIKKGCNSLNREYNCANLQTTLVKKFHEFIYNYMNTDRFNSTEIKNLEDNVNAICFIAEQQFYEIEQLNDSDGNKELGENNVLELLDPESMTREHWQDLFEFKNPFQTLPKEVKKIFSKIAIGKTDFGTVKYAHPTSMYRYLMQQCNDCIGGKDVIERINDFIDYYSKVKDYAKEGSAYKTESESMYMFFIGLQELITPKPYDAEEDKRNKIKNLNALVTSIQKGYFVYQAANIKNSNGRKQYTTFTINKAESSVFSSQLSRVILGTLPKKYNKEAKNNYIFIESENKIKFNSEGFKNFKQTVSKISETDIPAVRDAIKKGKIFGFGNLNGTKDNNMFKLELEQITRVLNALQSLGFELSPYSELILVTHPQLYIRVLDNLSKIASLKNLNGLITFNLQPTYEELYNSENESFKSYLDNIASALNATDAYNMSYSARYINEKGKHVTRQAIVQSSFLTDMAKSIKNLRGERLKKYIEDKWLKYGFFTDGEGNVKSKWISEMLNPNSLFNEKFELINFLGMSDSSDGNSQTAFENLGMEKTFATQIVNFFSNFQRKMYINSNDYDPVISNVVFTNLEHKDIKTAEFGAKEGAETNNANLIYYNPTLNKFYSKSKNGKFESVTPEQSLEYANYPVFILGDSNKSMYITAPTYTLEDIADGLYDTFEQEIKLMNQIKALNDKLISEGHKPLQNSGKWVEDDNGRHFETKREFGFLKILNDDKEEFIRNYTNNVSKNDIKAKIMERVSLQFEQYLSDLEKEGFLTINKQDGSVYCPTLDNLDNGERRSTARSHREMLKFYFYNTKFAYIQQIELTTISPIFYESVKDFQKRYKEIYASGDSCNIEAIDPYSKDHKKYSETGMQTVKYFEDIKVDAAEVNKEFMDVIEELFKDDERVLNLYRESTVTDGQGYRSLKSYRAVMGMLHRWTDEMELAYQDILTIRRKVRDNPDYTLTEEDYKNLRTYQIIFQPLKPYCYCFENYEGVPIPVQHKYAEVVLIPELLPKGSALRDMAEYMEESDVDMICSTKCVKVGIFGQSNILKDNDGKEIKSKDALKNAFESCYSHQIPFSGYKLQTNVPNHVLSSRSIGTQIQKMSMAGVINKDDCSSYLTDVDLETGNTKYNVPKLSQENNPSKVTGRTVYNFYNQLCCAVKLQNTFKFINTISDKKRLSQSLIKNAFLNSSLKADKFIGHTLKFFGNNSKGEQIVDFTLDLCDPTSEYDTVAFIMSRLREVVVKHKINGGSAVQQSPYGTKGYETDGDLKYICDPENKNAENKNVLYAEVELQFAECYVDANGNTVKLKYEDYCDSNGELKLSDKKLDKFHPLYKQYLSWKNEDGTVSVPKIEVEFPGILDIVAYRIPTEKEYSSMHCKVKRFTVPTGGGTIKVPAVGTVIAGFDFDIDKLYLLRKEFKEITEGKKDWLQYDYSKLPLQNNIVGINNMILQLMLARFADRDNVKDRYTPGGFPNASKAARLARELEFSDFDKIDEFKDGKITYEDLKNYIENDPKGLFDPEPDYDITNPITFLKYNEQNQVAAKLIGVFANHDLNHIYSLNLKTFKLKDAIKFGFHTKEGLSDLIDKKNRYNIGVLMAEFLSSSVDAVKDPVLNFLNLNTQTADIAAMLIRIGYTMDELAILLNQPIIKQLVKRVQNGESLNLSYAINDIISEYAHTKDNPIYLDRNENVELNCNILIGELVKNKKSNILAIENRTQENLSVQIAVLNLMKQLIKQSSDLRSWVNATKFTAANSVKTTFGDFDVLENNIEDFTKKYTDESFSLIIEKGGDTTGRIFPIEYNSIEYLNSAFKDLKLLSENSNSKQVVRYLENLIANPLSLEQCTLDCLRYCVNKIKELYFPYNHATYKDMIQLLTRYSKSNNIDTTTINQARVEFISYILSNLPTSILNGQIPASKLGSLIHDYTGNESADVTSFEGLIESFGNDKTIKQLFQNNEFVKWMVSKLELTPLGLDYDKIVNRKSNTITYKIIPNKGKVSLTDFGMDEEWNNFTENKPFMATLLFMYNYYNVGLIYAPNSMMKLFPKKFLASVNIAKITNGAESRFENYSSLMHKITNGELLADRSVRDFCKLYILNHTDNYKFKYKFTKFNKTVIKNDINKISFNVINEQGEEVGNSPIKYSNSLYKDIAKVDSITFNISNAIDVEDQKDEYANLISKLVTSKEYEKDGELKTITFIPLIQIENQLFMIENPIVDGNTVIIKYVKTFPKGVNNQYIDYNSDVLDTEADLPSNQYEFITDVLDDIIANERNETYGDLKSYCDSDESLDQKDDSGQPICK